MPLEPLRESPLSTRPSQRLRQKTSQELSSSPSGLNKYNGGPIFSTPQKDKDEEKASARKHRSVNVPATESSREKPRERRRESIGIPLSSGSRASAPKHTRSASSSSSNVGGERPHRRGQTSDFSHLPPSPSTSSIQHFLRHSNSISKDAAAGPHGSPNVGQSLLRGTQEGWSALDDEATVEALRKLDGISGKSARARTSIGIGIGSRPGSTSRPGTPGKATGAGAQWEGIEGGSAKAARRKSNGLLRESMPPKPREELVAATESGEDAHSSSGPEKSALKKTGSASARSSLAAKRGSSSLTTYTGTTATSSSRESAQLLTRRNSNGSDTSVHSSDVASLKDRTAALAHGAAVGSGADGGADDEKARVPPVPPLPKNLSGFRSPPQSSAGVSFTSVPAPEEVRKEKEREQQVTLPAEETDADRTVSLEVPPMIVSSYQEKPTTPQFQQAQLPPGQQAQELVVGSAPAATKTPSRKWSFNALGLGMRTPSSKDKEKEKISQKQPEQGKVYTSDGGATSFGSADEGLVPGTASKRGSWAQPHAMESAASLASLSSIGSGNTRGPGVSLSVAQGKNESSDRLAPSRTETASSASHHTQGGGPEPALAPLSPSSSVRRQTSKRLTPSSIPFFRRSSSQSMKVQPPLAGSGPRAASPNMTSSPAAQASRRLTVVPAVPSLADNSLSSPSTPGSASAHKKSSVLSLGSLLKGSSSRKSLHSDKSDYFPEKEGRQSFEKSREKAEKEKKKDDKDRSESRISVLMGRKRGKVGRKVILFRLRSRIAPFFQTVSSSDAKKPAKAVTLPPMLVQPLPRDTAQRVANLKNSASSSTGSTAKAAAGSRVTSQTISSMHKQSDTSLRSSRSQLPTIAGSPSVGTTPQAHREPKELPPSSLNNSASGLPKETPTKIPRISSRTSGIPSPTLKGTAPTAASRRTSLTVGTVTAPSTDPSPTPSGTINEFGVLESSSEEPPATATKPPASNRLSVRASPSQPIARIPRQVSAPQGSSTISGVPRKSNRESMSFSGLRKSSTGSVASFSTAAPTETKHRSFALSPSKGLKLLSPKVSLSAARRHDSDHEKASYSTGHLASAASSRQSLSTPSPVPSSVDEEEILGDEEMMQYIKRQQAKKLAAGASPEEVNDMLKFPEPTAPVKPASPEGKSSDSSFLKQELKCVNQTSLTAARRSTCLTTNARKSNDTLRCISSEPVVRRRLPL
jgi:dual specificity tyrosine-phosphorylation-regulated kinase 2/3/4